jgi:hypothetical protein
MTSSKTVYFLNSSIRKECYILNTVQGVEVQGVSRDVMHVALLGFQNELDSRNRLGV